jgi:hypothetical protein
MKNQNRCIYSGELTTNKKVILEKYVVEYLKKLGYLVSNSNGEW